MVLLASILSRVGSLPLGPHVIFSLLAKLHPPSITIKLKVSFTQSSASTPDPGNLIKTPGRISRSTLKANLAPRMLANPTCHEIFRNTEQQNTDFARQAELRSPCYMIIGLIRYMPDVIAQHTCQ
jgi:hypothetical protein